MLLQGGTALDVLVDFFLDEVREDWIDILTALGRAGALYKRKVREGLWHTQYSDTSNNYSNKDSSDNDSSIWRRYRF